MAHTIPYNDFQQAAVDLSKKMLYYEYADESGEYGKELAALRYKTLLYSADGNGNISARFENMATLWTEADRSRALSAAQEIKDALKYDVLNLNLRDALLDIYYDIAVADLAKAAEKMVEAQKAALGLPGYIAPPGEFLISEEIELLHEALDLYDAAAQPYFNLLKDPLGVDMALIDSAAAADNIPFGYFLFQTEVPDRSYFAPLYKDQNGDLQAVVDEPDALFTGYKDLTLLFKMECDAARAAAKLAKLYALRGDVGDAGAARQVIGDRQQKSYTGGTILNGIFSADDLSKIDTGLAEARAGWSQALSSLSGVKSFLDGDANPLGLDKGFLALVQQQGPGDGDTYDYFANLLIPGGDDAHLSGALGDANIKYNEAYNSYEQFRVNQDTIQNELENQRRLYGDRLRAIAGAKYPDPSDASAKYHSPENNVGSEIYLQLKNIEMAKLRIERNKNEIENLQAQIQNEIERRGQKANISNLIQDTYIEFGDKHAKITEEIGYIKATQVAVDVWARGLSKWLTSIGASVGAQQINATFQHGAEIRKDQLKIEQERLSALQSAKVTF